MREFHNVLASVAFAVASLSFATAAEAQATRTWVSGVGDDANPCSRTAPCKTFAGAISKTATGGEIDVLDPGGFGALTITKAITVRADNVEAGVLVSGVNGFVVSAGAADHVVIDGLDFEGVGTGLSGIEVVSAGDVLIRNCIIRDFKAGNASGVHLSNTALVRVTIDHTTIYNNGTGVSIASSPNTGKVKLQDSLVLSNPTAGVKVVGSGNNVTIAGSTVIGSTKALDFVAGGGSASSYGNNVLSAGDTPVALSLQ